jgi:predicted transcriptional regulator
MARRKTAELTLAQMVQPIRRFRDTVRRMNQAIEQVELSSSDGWARQPEEGSGPPIPWEIIRRQELASVRTAVQSVDSAVEALATLVVRMQENEHRGWIQAAVDLARWALREGEKDDIKGRSFSHSGKYYLKNLQRADGWVAFVEDVATLQAMPTWQREALQVIDERGPSTQKELATAMGKATLSSNERQGLSEMVQAGLLNSGRGHESNGYSLTQLGLRMAQLSRQLRDF